MLTPTGLQRTQLLSGPACILYQQLQHALVVGIRGGRNGKEARLAISVGFDLDVLTRLGVLSGAWTDINQHAVQLREGREVALSCSESAKSTHVGCNGCVADYLCSLPFDGGTPASLGPEKLAAGGAAATSPRGAACKVCPECMVGLRPGMQCAHMWRCALDSGQVGAG